MKITRLSSALALVTFIPCVLSAQNPADAHHPAMSAPPAAAPAMRRMAIRSLFDGHMMAPMMDAASMFLGHTGDLQLTDAQVTKLAAIARRAQTREQAMRARMDSAMVAMRSGDAAAMPRDGAMGGMMMTMMRMPMPTEAERKAQHEDDRDAFAVLTPDQLATAWEMMAARHMKDGGHGM